MGHSPEGRPGVLQQAEDHPRQPARKGRPEGAAEIPETQPRTLPPAPPPPPAAHHPAGHVAVMRVIIAYAEVTPEEGPSTGRRHKSITKVTVQTDQDGPADVT